MYRFTGILQVDRIVSYLEVDEYTAEEAIDDQAECTKPPLIDLPPLQN